MDGESHRRSIPSLSTGRTKLTPLRIVYDQAYSAASATSPLASTSIPRRGLTDRSVQIEILFCGVCHSDLHYARDEWHDVMPTVYPCVPGHEIAGRITRRCSIFCGAHNITAHERMATSDVKYRFSIDMASLKSE